MSARCFYNNNGNTHEENVILSRVSLGGALIEGLRHYTSDTMVVIKPERSGLTDVELIGEIIGRQHGGVAVQFYYYDIHGRRKLWDYIKRHVVPSNVCPYCGKKIHAPSPQYCPNCRWLLDLSDDEYLLKHDRETFAARLQNRTEALTNEQLGRIVNCIDSELLKDKSGLCKDKFVGTSDCMQKVFSLSEKVAATDMNVLILGESGTGKELTARAIHTMSQRRQKPFVAVNCAAIPEGLLEAELFGYERGSFTGAYNSRKGKFELADGGTVFLDEIGDMPLNLQSKILRFLQERVVERIGSLGGKKIDVRLIAATNLDIVDAVKEEKFRHDLYYRLDEFSIGIPPVRARGDDSVTLARHFLLKFCSEMGVTRRFTNEAITAIRQYHWPGNVREIINKVKRAIVVSEDMQITPETLGVSGYSLAFPCDQKLHIESLKKIKNDVERQMLREALSSSGNNYSQAAKLLGVSRTSIYNLKKKYAL
ncbi:MAG TPA: sigma-54-dependent Fis family transcriptional regulator [Nitrospiraceae bacterium]|nr:sigma-54-dependent Fis family transcriptional regulator [Nitrospiraceae bacterium]